jgi:hypothetical protein
MIIAADVSLPRHAKVRLSTKAAPWAIPTSISLRPVPYPENSYIPDDVLVVCPRCERRALVQTGGDNNDRPLRLSCTHCGFSREAVLEGGALRSRLSEIS